MFYISFPINHSKFYWSQMDLGQTHANADQINWCLLYLPILESSQFLFSVMGAVFNNCHLHTPIYLPACWQFVLRLLHLHYSKILLYEQQQTLLLGYIDIDVTKGTWVESLMSFKASTVSLSINAFGWQFHWDIVCGKNAYSYCFVLFLFVHFL